MPDIQKISIALTREQLVVVKKAVESGAYASTSEVIRDALRGWEIREQIRQSEIERIRRLWEDGLASGPMKPLDFEDVKRRGRERLAGLKAG